MIDILKKILHLFIFKKSYSQDNEDLFLVNYFQKREKGFYVDLGCHHPKRFSNTYLLYKKGWSGINIDFNKLTIFLFNFFRLRDQNINAVISISDDPIIFFEFYESALNGILSQERVSELKKLGFKVKRKKTIRPITIQEVIEKYSLSKRHIDFLKIDVEGLDFEIIKNVELNKLDIELLMIEKSSKKENENIIKYLRIYSYDIIYKTQRNFIFKKFLKIE